MLQITFEFVGGPNDGNVFHGTLGQGQDAERYYLFSNHGAIGQRFKVASEYAVETLTREKLRVGKRRRFHRHYYFVTDRVEEPNEVWVRAEYLPEAVSSG